MMAESFDVVIIGGGVIGLSAAYYLASMGAGSVVVLEKSRLGEGSTGKCAGGIRLQFSTEINIQFSILSMEVYEHFSEQFGVSIDFKQDGYLFLACTDGEMALFEKSAVLQKKMNVPVKILSSDDIETQWSFLNSNDIRGGAFCARDGYAGPYEVVRGFYEQGKSKGVKYRENEEVLAIECNAGKVKGVRTSLNEYSCSSVINAAGSHSALIGAMVGFEIPVRAYRRQLFFTGPCDLLPPRLPLIIDHHRGWYFRREGKGLLLAGPQDRESSYNTITDPLGMDWAVENALFRVPLLAACTIEGGWGGSYDITPDCHAIIGGLDHIEGFYCACGFSGHGFMHAPAAGMFIAELIHSGSVSGYDISSLSPHRFERGNLLYESYTVFKE